MKITYALSLLALTATTLAKCCSRDKCTYQVWDGRRFQCTRWECGDGSSVSMFECCGYRKCNIFCCNCDKTGDGKVCRVGDRSLLVEDEPKDAMSDDEMFVAANTNGTGELTLAEFAVYMGGRIDDLTLLAKFTTHDRNGDGVLTIDELRL